MKVLVACEFSGTVRDAFIRAGHDAISCDLLPTESPGPHIQGDMWDTKITKQHWDLAIIHPSCRYLCNSGVRWLHEHPWRMNLMRSGAFSFKACLDDFPAESVAVENPIMHPYAIEIIERKPDQIVQPWWFGDPFLKATCWWLRNLRPLEKTSVLTPPKDPAERRKWAAVHQAGPGDDRWKRRSKFYPGMAEACTQWAT